MLRENRITQVSCQPFQGQRWGQSKQLRAALPPRQPGSPSPAQPTKIAASADPNASAASCVPPQKGPLKNQPLQHCQTHLHSPSLQAQEDRVHWIAAAAPGLPLLLPLPDPPFFGLLPCCCLCCWPSPAPLPAVLPPSPVLLPLPGWPGGVAAAAAAAAPLLLESELPGSGRSFKISNRTDTRGASPRRPANAVLRPLQQRAQAPQMPESKSA